MDVKPLGIISYGVYVPFWRLSRAEIAKTLKSAAGSTVKGARRVANFDEDTTTMGAAAAKFALKSLATNSSSSKASEDTQENSQRDLEIDSLWFSTAEPAYLEKTNATAIHSALLMDTTTSALDLGGASRSGIGALKNALSGGGGTNMVVLSGMRSGLPGSSDEVLGGDGAVAFLTGEENSSKNSPHKLIARYVEGTSTTREFLDRWRLPGQSETHQWEERFGQYAYEPLVEKALAGLQTKLQDLDALAISGTHTRAVKDTVRKISPQLKESAQKSLIANDLIEQIGNTGAAHPGIMLASMLEAAKPGQKLGLIWLADGVEILICETTAEIENFHSFRTLSAQLHAGAEVSYIDFLRWRDVLKTQPPNRPEPPRISAPAALRSDKWKYGFVGSRGENTDTLHLPPSRVSIRPGDAYDEMIPAPMADVGAKVVTYTIDRLVYSKNPPVIFAIVDFDGGGRFPVELTDVEESEVAIGMKVEMTFRRLYTAEDAHNYFYKARPVRH